MDDAPRLARLLKVFERVCSNTGTFNPFHLLESIYSHPDPPACLSRLIGSSDQRGLNALQSSLHSDGTVPFLDSHASNLCTYLSKSEVQSIHGGAYLAKVVAKIVEPPIFWDAFAEAFMEGDLPSSGEAIFVRLLLQVVSSPHVQGLSDSLSSEKVNVFFARLQQSTDPATCRHVYKLQSFIESGTVIKERSAGGRRDNDHVDFRRIAIMPTASELECDKPPFLRDASYLDENKPDVLTHLDNQFRLLREDMLGEIREEIDIVLGKKKGRHRGGVFDPVELAGLAIPGERERGIVGIRLQCKQDLWQLKDLNAAKRKTFLMENKNVIKHQSLSCLIADDRITAFPSIHRDEDLLAKRPPVIVVVVGDVDVASKVLLSLGACKNIKLVPIDTAVFAYEPFLAAL